MTMNDIKNEHQKWPSDGLEYVPRCPICDTKSRELLHEKLNDNNLFHAPGNWSMYRCSSCSSTYLDPRPTPETIALAYKNYYTHDERASFSSLSLLKKLQRILVNGYINYNFGTKNHPASILGILVINLMPTTRLILDSTMRHLPKAKPGMRLLDLGCGNGKFLLQARSAGWDVVGVDFDQEAVDVACMQGLDVRLGGIDILDPRIEQFDVITLSHIIEHVHQPIDILKACNRLLKPGGFLWLDTPNSEAEGHRVFGANWRGLEPPRHLAIFSFESMNKTLKLSGFVNIEIQAYQPSCKHTFKESNKISGYTKSNLKLSRMIKKSNNIAKHNTARREFITVKAWKK
ncbi:bifunctional 2-polyprenyl-6-hydroxyphenol methylase/3-demethylubiquinol 3-O-methyltransferase UbiG [uncultured Cocleimonas sp.]|uniref:class I SAM-dependent methyltransferase n=1 Tax=uncultured Cocleimonas sp. TaxID=1051587 RepID=UPI0026251DD2|nr:class I SAM-dependent methyltransferase [uncultured Cocleimonas sp.]